jgi:hypothetical protein
MEKKRIFSPGACAVAGTAIQSEITAAKEIPNLRIKENIVMTPPEFNVNEPGL